MVPEIGRYVWVPSREGAWPGAVSKTRQNMMHVLILCALSLTLCFWNGFHLGDKLWAGMFVCWVWSQGACLKGWGEWTLSRKHQSEIKSSLKMPRVTYSVLSRVRWLIAKLQVHGYLNKRAGVVQIDALPCTISDTESRAGCCCPCSISMYLSFSCIVVWHMKWFIPHNSPELHTQCAIEQGNRNVK